jgi:GTP1/Obg family GTP-binding protein
VLYMMDLSEQCDQTLEDQVLPYCTVTQELVYG